MEDDRRAVFLLQNLMKAYSAFQLYLRNSNLMFDNSWSV